MTETSSPLSSATRSVKLSRKSISPRMARSVISRTCGADAGPVGQFVDHFGLDERRIHVEADQPPAAAVDVVALERDVEPRCSERFMNRSCIAARSSSVSDPRTESSMHDLRRAVVLAAAGTRPCQAL